MAVATRFSLRNYDPKYLTCRDIAHAFEIIGYYRGADGLTKRKLRCLRCKAIGHDTLSVIGERRKGRSYVYPDGYLIPGGMPRVDIRREEMRRATIFRNEEDMIAGLKLSAQKKKRATNKKTYPVKHRSRQKARA